MHAGGMAGWARAGKTLYVPAGWVGPHEGDGRARALTYQQGGGVDEGRRDGVHVG